MRRIVDLWSSFLVVALATLTGCGPPPMSDEEIAREPPLRLIHESFIRTIRDARETPDMTWHSGWFGNQFVHLLGEGHYGLCYHWQDMVYAGVVADVRDLGWEVTGVNVNLNEPHEHHAVLVYDPARYRPPFPLAADEADAAWVLDGWRRGRPDVYSLHVWLTLTPTVHRPAELQTLPTEYRDGGMFPPWIPREGE